MVIANSLLISNVSVAKMCIMFLVAMLKNLAAKFVDKCLIVESINVRGNVIRESVAHVPISQID